MNKTDTIDHIALSADLSKEAAGRVMDAFEARLKAHISEGKRVVFRGFGSFSRGLPAQKTGRNPRTAMFLREFAPTQAVIGVILLVLGSAVASLAMLVAFALLPMTQRWPGWLDAPGSPRATALTLTSRDPGRARVAKVAHGTGRPATRGAVSRESLAKADPSRDLDVPEDLRRNPGLFIDMPLVRRLEKLRHLEAVYRQDGMGGGGAG